MIRQAGLEERLNRFVRLVTPMLIHIYIIATSILKPIVNLRYERHGDESGSADWPAPRGC